MDEVDGQMMLILTLVKTQYIHAQTPSQGQKGYKKSIRLSRSRQNYAVCHSFCIFTQRSNNQFSSFHLAKLNISVNVDVDNFLTIFSISRSQLSQMGPDIDCCGC